MNWTPALFLCLTLIGLLQAAKIELSRSDLALQPAHIIVGPWKQHIPPTKRQGGLMLDERDNVTYPNGVQARDGSIHIIYDHQRPPLGEVLMATFRKKGVRAGKQFTDKGHLRELINRLPYSDQQPTK